MTLPDSVFSLEPVSMRASLTMISQVLPAMELMRLPESMVLQVVSMRQL